MLLDEVEMLHHHPSCSSSADGGNSAITSAFPTPASTPTIPPSPPPFLTSVVANGGVGNGIGTGSRPSSPEEENNSNSNGCNNGNEEAKMLMTTSGGSGSTTTCQSGGSSNKPYKMGYFGATSYVIGNIIGSGIFITPSTIVRYTDSAGLSLLIWVLGAGIAFLGSLCYIELGTSIREAGCDFAYICYVKWYSVAFSFMWVSVLMTYPATIAIIAETFGQYLMEGLRQTYAVDTLWALIAQKCFGITLLWLITWMNFFALGKFAARFQIAATVAKLLACSLIILTGFYYMFVLGWNEGLREPMANSRWNLGDLMMGLYGGLYAYSGWDILNYGTNEIERPRRNAPLALLSGIFIVFLVYFCINVAYFVVLDVETMKTSNAVAALFSQRTLGGFSEAIPFLIGVLLIGSLNSNLFCGSRYMYAAAKQGHLPACFSCINHFHESPRVAVFAQFALAVAICFVGDLDALIGYAMFGFWAQRVFSLCALLTIRHQNIPVHPDCIRVPLPCIYLFLAINIVLVAVPIWQEFAVTSLGISICVLGLGFYYIFINFSSSKFALLAIINEKATFLAQIFFDAQPDVKPQQVQQQQPTAVRRLSLLLASDSQRELLLLPSAEEASEELPSPGVLDLHADEKNRLIRNGSAVGLRMW